MLISWCPIGVPIDPEIDDKNQKKYKNLKINKKSLLKKDTRNRVNQQGDSVSTDINYFVQRVLRRAFQDLISRWEKVKHTCRPQKFYG